MSHHTSPRTYVAYALAFCAACTLIVAPGVTRGEATNELRIPDIGKPYWKVPEHMGPHPKRPAAQAPPSAKIKVQSGNK